jgi:hypothetical protein
MKGTNCLQLLGYNSPTISCARDLSSRTLNMLIKPLFGLDHVLIGIIESTGHGGDTM